MPQCHVLALQRSFEANYFQALPLKRKLVLANKELRQIKHKQDIKETRSSYHSVATTHQHYCCSQRGMLSSKPHHPESCVEREIWCC